MNTVSKNFYAKPLNKKEVTSLKEGAKEDSAKSINKYGDLTGLAAKINDSDNHDKISLKEQLIRESVDKIERYK